MAEDDIAFLLNRGELVEHHENEQPEGEHDSGQKQSQGIYQWNKTKFILH